tara:strand:+ start:257 stop:601 length:345 start_codon:yes stop_codon:yes gene_type:complete
MVKVYFETQNGSYSEQVATFETEELYIICLPALKKEAKKQGYKITESIEEEEETKDLFEFYEDQPKEVSSILEQFVDLEAMTYEELSGLQKNLETIGYTFEYGLDAQPYNLRKI